MVWICATGSLRAPFNGVKVGAERTRWKPIWAVIEAVWKSTIDVNSTEVMALDRAEWRKRIKVVDQKNFIKELVIVALLYF